MAIPPLFEHHLYYSRKTNRIEYTDTAKYEQHYASTSTTDEAERLYKAIRTLPETERAIISSHLDGYDNK